MIVIDASALVAILLEEPEAQTLREFLLLNPGASLSPVGYWEAATRLRTLRGERGLAELDIVIQSLEVEVAPATAATARLASAAERAFGKRTPAKLNLGDCFAYALAKELNAPLLYKGDDFALTDVAPAV
ncbi:MAG: type II toxin-antitoxin system VapC family toxin [Brevundimonas sp.]